MELKKISDREFEYDQSRVYRGKFNDERDNLAQKTLDRYSGISDTSARKQQQL